MKQGQPGIVEQIDKDGDFLIRFQGLSERQWVLKKYIGRVRIATEEERKAAEAAALAAKPPPRRAALAVTVRAAADDGSGEGRRSPGRSVMVSNNAAALAVKPREKAASEWVGCLLRSAAVSSTSLPAAAPNSEASTTASTSPASSTAAAAAERGGLIKGLFMSSVASSAAPSTASTPASALAGVLRSSVAASESISVAAHGQQQLDSDAPPTLVLRECSKRKGFYPLGETAVWLHIYDVSGSTLHLVNNIARPVGTGAFHAGVEVYGQEWSFGYAAEQRTGVYNCRPRCNTSHKYRESLPMGVTNLSEAEVRKLIEELRVDWLGLTYDLLVRNCCHFSDTLCRALGVGPTPEWVTHLAGAGARLVGGVDQAVASAHAARGLAAAIDEHYQITPAVEALFSREFEMVDEDYVRQKAQDLWAGAIDTLAPVGNFAESAMDKASKAMTLESVQEGFWDLWSKGAQKIQAPAHAVAAGWRVKEKDDARVVKVSMPRELSAGSEGDISPWSSAAPTPQGCTIRVTAQMKGDLALDLPTDVDFSPKALAPYESPKAPEPDELDDEPDESPKAPEPEEDEEEEAAEDEAEAEVEAADAEEKASTEGEQSDQVAAASPAAAPSLQELSAAVEAAGPIMQEREVASVQGSCGGGDAGAVAGKRALEATCVDASDLVDLAL